MAEVPVQVEHGGQFGLIEHHDVRPLLADEPVEVPLLLLPVDAAHVPHEHRQGHPRDVEISIGLWGVPLRSPMQLG